MKLEALKEIENKYNFKYPEIYRKLSEDNMLNWGEVCSSWFENEYPKLKNNPPLLLYYWDFDIISSSKEIIDNIDFYSDEECYLEIKKEYYYKFIPFGKTGGGDLYCFFLDEDNKIKHIVLLLHDDDDAEILANIFQEFIFRFLLMSVIELDKDTLIMEGNLNENCNNLFKTHKKYLTDKQNSIIQNIYKRTSIPKLDDKELNNILKENGFENNTINCYEF
ncbi:SMI1/KNR4 family protein [Tenacibaculum salmonis]|uniref:SMI1/KNR4 family protein n=1 Tax=Tenacibaculum sp. P3-BQ1 TaxID=3232310 RepID=UPI0034DF03F8